MAHLFCAYTFYETYRLEYAYIYITQMFALTSICHQSSVFFSVSFFACFICMQFPDLVCKLPSNIDEYKQNIRQLLLLCLVYTSNIKKKTTRPRSVLPFNSAQGLFFLFFLMQMEINCTMIICIQEEKKGKKSIK